MSSEEASAPSKSSSSSSRSQVIERNRLGFTESDWNLPGTGYSSLTTTSSVSCRTRHGGVGRPNLMKRKNELPPTSSEDEDWSHESETADDGYTSDDELELEKSREKLKPPSSNIIIGVKALTETLGTNCICQQCHGPVDVTIKTICLASRIIITCKDEECGFVFDSPPPDRANLDNNKDDERHRTTDFSLNIMYVLGFESVGDGGVEAARILGLLGLPNDTTMESRSFPTIEERINAKMEKLTSEILQENLIKEVQLSHTACGLDNSDFELWKQAIMNPDGSFGVLQSKYPKIDVSFDMGWQQRSSGKKYASPSGHALLVGARTRKAVAMLLKSKLCTFCISWAKKNAGPIPPHYCRKNHEGSSSAMEPQACLEMVVGLFVRRKCVVARICLDDDASTRSLLRWSNADWMKNNNVIEKPKVLVTKGKFVGELQDRPDKGMLPAEIPEPTFVADPNHRRKCFTKELYKLKESPAAVKHGMTGMDLNRLKKNFGYMARTLKNKAESELVDTAKAVIEHHFDEHKYCGVWCPRRLLSEEQKKATRLTKFYRSKTADAKLYEVLTEKISRFITLDKLKEIWHSMDTQINESFNNTAAWVAPKNKVYCGSCSLSNRLSLAVGVTSIGMVAYFTRLSESLGITVSPAVAHYLAVKEKTRFKRHEDRKKPEVKKLRSKRLMDQLRAETRKVIKGRAKKDGTYLSGMNMAADTVDGYTLDDLLEAATKKPAAKRRKVDDNIVCKHCNVRGHSLIRSKYCLKNPANMTATADIIPQAASIPSSNPDDELLAIDAAADVDADDSMPFIPDDPESDVSLSMFQDTRTWSSSDSDDSSAVI